MTRPARTAGLQRLLIVTIVTTLGLIALGGAVRATDSGLACPTWPGCFTAGDFLPPAGLHVWLEHSHRLLAIVVGLLVAAVTLWVLLRHRHRGDLLWPTLAAAVAVNVQAVLGAFVVWRWLEAWLVTAHLTLALLILAALVAVAINLAWPRPGRAAAKGLDLRLGRLSGAVVVLAMLQIAVGGQVTGVGAGLAYGLEGFPLMDGALFPSPAEADARELYHAAHRLGGFALLAAAGALWWRSVRERRVRRLRGTWGAGHDWLVRLAAAGTVLVGLQILIGVANIWSSLSWVSVIPHLTVASWLFTALFLHAMLAHRWAESATAGDPPATTTPAEVEA